MDFTEITEADKRVLARDLLRGRESDYYRLSLLNEPRKEERLAELAAEIEAIRAVVAAQDEAAPQDPEVPAEGEGPVDEDDEE